MRCSIYTAGRVTTDILKDLKAHKRLEKMPLANVYGRSRTHFFKTTTGR